MKLNYKLKYLLEVNMDKNYPYLKIFLFVFFDSIKYSL
jgi:hypothetical protein